MCNPFDQVLNCVYDKDDNKYRFQRNFMLEQYKFRLKVRQPVIEDIKKLTAPIIKFEKDN